jgi:hypothetical protein
MRSISPYFLLEPLAKSEFAKGKILKRHVLVDLYVPHKKLGAETPHFSAGRKRRSLK